MTDLNQLAPAPDMAEHTAQVREDALREAAVNLKTYAPHLVDGPEHDRD